MTEQRRESGFPVVLTADRTLMARYQVLFDGMMSASQTTRTPGALMKCLLAPSIPSEGVRACRAPLGLRRIEAALVRGGWSPQDVAAVCPEQLKQAIGPDTRVIGMSSGDPLGHGMNSSTMVGIAGGEIYTSRWFRRLSTKIVRLRELAPRARVVMGGAGAWQLAGDSETQRELRVDHVVTGYCEGNVAAIFSQIADGGDVAPVVKGDGVSAELVPPIRGASSMGAVEISRGCGLGCGFCTIGREPMGHVPMETVIADVETNVAAGVTNVSLVTEDMFRYGADGGRARPEALIDLLRRIRSIPQVQLVQTDHANIATVAQFSDGELEEVHRLFVGVGGRHDFVWLNLGVETAAGGLLAANGGAVKMRPFQPDDWADACFEQISRLTRAGFFPMISLLMGMPGETEAHVEETSRWVSRLADERVAVFPLFYAPINGRDRAFGVGNMSDAHWRLFRQCYRLNFKWMPRLCWDNQRGGGVALWRRLMLQCLGRMQVLWWKGLFAWRSGRL